MVVFSLSEKLKFWIVAVISLAATGFWSFQGLSKSFYGGVEMLSCLFLLATVLFNSSVLTRKNALHFKVFALLFLFLPFVSAISSNVFHEQQIGMALWQVRVAFLWLFYFVLHIYNVPVEKIIKLMIFIGCGWAFLTIIQQFTYPFYLFYTRDEDNNSILRAGVYRFMLAGEQFGVLALVYFFYKYATTNNIRAGMFVLFLIAGVYFYGTRQYLVAVLASMFLCVFYLKSITKWKYIMGFFAFFALIVAFSSALFAELIEMTSDQMDDKDYVRFLAADFFLNEYWPHWSTKLLGNGRPYEFSNYGQAMKRVSAMGFIRSDVGIIGVYNEFGLIYVLNILSMLATGVILKMKENSRYLKILFFYTIALLFLSISFTHNTSTIFYCLLFYAIDKSLKEQPTPAPKTQKRQVAHELVVD